MKAKAMKTFVRIIVFATAFPLMLTTGRVARAESPPSDIAVTIPLRDGTSVAGRLFRPAPSGKFPAILIHTPYDRKYGESPARGRVPDELVDLADRYALVVVQGRGEFASTAGEDGLGNPQHGRDGYDIVEWIARRPWSNGKVGTWGASAAGAVQFQTAIEEPPHLLCAMPMAAFIGFPYERFYYGGVPRRLYLIAMEGVGPGIGKIVRDHPILDDFWKAEGAKFDPSRIDLPMLMVTGWFDMHLGNKIKTFQRVRRQDKNSRNDMKLIIGPWLHNRIGKSEQGALQFPAMEGFVAESARHLFDYFLRGDMTGPWKRLPAVRYYQMGSNEWRSADEWPPEAAIVPYYLSAGGRLGLEPPAWDTRETYTYDPMSPTPTVGGNLVEAPKTRFRILPGPRDLRRRVESRDDVLTFSTEVLEKDVVVAGPIEMKLFVASEYDDTDFAVWLSDVHPDGRSMLVCDGIQRMSLSQSLEKHYLVPVESIYEMTVTLPPTAQTFLKGHRIRVSISSSNYPRFEVNRNVDPRPILGPNMRVTTNSVYHDEWHASALLLPVVDR